MWCWPSELAARYHAWIAYMSEGETDEDFEFINQIYYPWNLVTGATWDLRKPKGQIMTFLIHLFMNPFIWFNFYASFETIIRSFDWRVDFSLQMLMVFVIGMVNYLVFLNPLMYRKVYFVMYRMIKEDFFTYDLDIRRKCEITKNLYELFRKCFPFFVLMSCSLLVVFLFFKPTADTRYVNGLDLAMLIPFYYPFKIEGWPFFIFMNIFQLLILATVNVLTALGVYTIVYHLVQWVYQMERLIDSLNAIEERALHRLSRVVGWSGQGLDKYELYHDKDFVKSYNECLKENIQHHVILNSYLLRLQDTSEVPLFISLISGSIMLAAMLSVLSMEDMETGARIWSSVLLLLAFGGFGFCILGQKVNDIAEELREAIYDLEWYSGHVDIQNNFVMLMEVTRKPIKPVLFSIFTYDLTGLTKVLQTAYTYYNLILMSRGMEMDVL